MSKKPYGKRISKLTVIDFMGFKKNYNLNDSNTKEITFNVGSAGIEYIVKQNDNKVIQHSGHYQFEAEWEEN